MYNRNNVGGATEFNYRMTMWLGSDLARCQFTPHETDLTTYEPRSGVQKHHGLDYTFR